MENITENNKLIAEFMGLELEETLSNKFVYTRNEFNNPEKESDCQTNFYEKHELKYHFDWNWLIPVVENIEIQSKELFGEYEDVIINGCGCGIATKDDMISIAAKSKIEAVYIACVEFIKWYNEQNKK